MDLAGTVEWYDQNADAYAAQLNTAMPVAAIERFAKTLPPNVYVLEAGCGPGRETRAFAERSVRTAGVDLSEGLLAVARKANPGTEYVRADFRELPFDGATFDGVWAHASLVHLDTLADAEAALAEFNRVLKPGGVVYVAVKEKVGDEDTAVVTDTLSNHDRFFRYYTSDSLAQLLTRHGFGILESGHEEELHGRAEVKWIYVIARKSST